MFCDVGEPELSVPFRSAPLRSLVFRYVLFGCFLFSILLSFGNLFFHRGGSSCSASLFFPSFQLRALVQQSDASGVQQKTEMPYNPSASGEAQTAATTTTTVRYRTQRILFNREQSSANGGVFVLVRHKICAPPPTPQIDFSP